MLNNKFSDYKTINNVIAILSGLVAIALVLAPSTIATIFNISYLSQGQGSWVNSSRVVWILCVSISLLSNWARFVDEIYAQKIIMRFYSVIFAGFALSNFLGGIESNVPVHSISIALIAVLIAMASMCWNNSRGIEPNTKAINSSKTVSLINNTEEDQDILEANI
tara:strand:+ start:1004 stop:1498 length:495 start_codon:yes stop_codon:yes gene_type:complete